jgi:hypothetical protein
MKLCTTFFLCICMTSVTRLKQRSKSRQQLHEMHLLVLQTGMAHRNHIVWSTRPVRHCILNITLCCYSHIPICSSPTCLGHRTLPAGSQAWSCSASSLHVDLLYLLMSSCSLQSELLHYCRQWPSSFVFQSHISKSLSYLSSEYSYRLDLLVATSCSLQDHLFLYDRMMLLS